MTPRSHRRLSLSGLVVAILLGAGGAPGAHAVESPPSEAPATPAADAAAANPAADAAPRWSVDRTLAELVADPAPKAVIDHHLPGIQDNSHWFLFAGMTLRELQQQSPDTFSETALATIDAKLRAIR